MANDGVQWIRWKTRKGNSQWYAVSFVRPRKFSPRCMREKGTPGDVAARLLAALPEHFGREHVSAVHTLRAIRTIVNEALAVLERDFVALGDLESSPL